MEPIVAKAINLKSAAGMKAKLLTAKIKLANQKATTLFPSSSQELGGNKRGEAFVTVGGAGAISSVSIVAAGAVGGATNCIVGHPLDTLKVIAQVRRRDNFFERGGGLCGCRRGIQFTPSLPPLRSLSNPPPRYARAFYLPLVLPQGQPVHEQNLPHPVGKPRDYGLLPRRDPATLRILFDRVRVLALLHRREGVGLRARAVQGPAATLAGDPRLPAHRPHILVLRLPGGGHQVQDAGRSHHLEPGQVRDEDC